MFNKAGFGRSQSETEQTFDIYVARIPPEYDEAKLRDLFGSIGAIKGVSIKPGKGEHKQNYAFIKYESENDALCAVKYMNNSLLGTSNILVNYRKKEGSTSSENGGTGFGGFKPSSGDKPNSKGSGTSTMRGRGGFGSRGGFGGRGGGSQTRTGFITNGNGASSDEARNENMSDVFVWNEDFNSSHVSSPPPPLEEKVTEEKVLVVHVDHLTKFWGQPVSEENALVCGKIGAELQTHCPNAECVSGQLLSDRVFGCKFSIDDQWYRCKVEKHHPELGMKVKVRYVDWGNCEIVDQSKLFQLPLSLSQPPPCAREYELALKPVNDDENSETFKQGVDHLHSLLCEHVVAVTRTGNSPTVRAILDQTTKDIAEDIIAAGYAVAQVKNEEKPAFGFGGKASLPLRSPRSTTSPPQTNGNGNARESEELKKTIKNMQETEEKRKIELELMKQKNLKLEQSLARTESKLKGFSHSVVNEKFKKLMEDVASLKQVREDMHLDDALNPMLKKAVDMMAPERSPIVLSSMMSYQELLDSENDISTNQMNVKSCENKDDLGSLVKQRDDSRQKLLEKVKAFLTESRELPFDSRQQELEFMLGDIQKKYEQHMNTTECKLTVAQAVQAYESWRVKKIEDVKDMQQCADLCSLTLTNNLETLKQKVSLMNEPMLVEIGETVSDDVKNIDELIGQYSTACNKEVASIKESNMDTEGRNMIMNLVFALIQSINCELEDIKTLRDQLRGTYEKKQEAIEEWISRKPDVSKLRETKTQLKGLKSKFRHKQADRRDYEEDSDESDQIVKIEEEIENIRNQLHAAFINEHKLLEEISRVAETHFPELPLQYPDLGITTYMESNGLLQIRELEHYDHHALPLISSSTAQPVVFKTKFNQQPCVLKEYSLDTKLTKDIIKSRMFPYAKCNDPSLVSLDALFFDKAGRKAFLQTNFFGSGTLEDYVKAGPSPKVLLHQMLHSTLKALNSLHQNNCIHGNISPKNVFVKEEGKSQTAVLREPNFAKDEVERFKDVGSYSSTTSYPKFQAEKETPSKELDMYCFGLLMLWANVPDTDFAGNIKSLMKDHPAAEIIECLICNNPQSRLTAEAALKHAYFDAAEGRSQSPSEELLNTMKDLSDSFAIVEMNEPITEVFPSEKSEAKSDSEKTCQENGSSIEEKTPTEIIPDPEQISNSYKDESNGVKDEEAASQGEQVV